MKEFVEFIKENKVAVGIANVIFLVLFYFVNIPKASFLTYVIGFLVVEAFFLAMVYFVKRVFIDGKVI